MSVGSPETKTRSNACVSHNGTPSTKIVCALLPAVRYFCAPFDAASSARAALRMFRIA
jgi:hypothetical protein